MTEHLKIFLIETLTYFKNGLDDAEAGSEERQPMQDEVDYSLEAVKNLGIADVRLSFTDEKFRELFNELVSAGRDMQIRDNLGNSYMSEDMYFKDVKARYSNEV